MSPMCLSGPQSDSRRHGPLARSFRRKLLAQLIGLREHYPGTEVREETDITLRVRALGYKIVFTPFAVVEHIGAPQVVGRRFDLRYTYYAHRNHTVLLVRNFGLLSLLVWRNLICSSVSGLTTSLQDASKI